MHPQAGFDPSVHSDTSYEADALHPSHHGWMRIKYSGHLDSETFSSDFKWPDKTSIF